MLRCPAISLLAPPGLAQFDDLFGVCQLRVPVQIVQGPAVDPAAVLFDQLGFEEASGYT
jgi:hypothetical protein